MNSGSCFRASLLAALLLAPIVASGQETAASPGPEQSDPVSTPDAVVAPADVVAPVDKVELSGLASPSAKLSGITTSGQTTYPVSGVCPVITDYLYDLCQQTPDDPSCQPHN